MKKVEPETDEMAPKQTRAMITKAKELESAVSPLVKQLQNIKNTKVQEFSWVHHWEEIKKWAYKGNSRMTEEGNTIKHSTILNYMNVPLMASFGGKKEYISKFIINWYYNGNLYFDRPVEISVETIYKLTGLSNKSDPVPIGIKEGLVERLTDTPIGKNSKGLIIVQIKANTPKIVAKIVSTGLTITGRGCDLKLDMLEAIECIENSGKIYCWAQYVADVLKSIYEKC